MNECNEYISRLPTLDEVIDKEKLVAALKLNVENLTSKLTDQEDKCTKAMLHIRDQTSKLIGLQEKLQMAELEADKVRIQFETYRELTKEVGQMLDKREENARLIGENEMNKKLIVAMQENQKNANAKHENKVNELREKIKHEVNLVENGMLSLMNNELLLSKIKEIKECRQKLAEIRKMVSDQYADSIGSNASCITQ